MPQHEKKRWYDYAAEIIDCLDPIGWLFRGIFKAARVVFECIGEILGGICGLF